jgi:hypothetical protein
MAGVILSVRPIVRMGLSEWLWSQSELGGGSFIPTPEEVQEQSQRSADATASRTGAIMALVGTVIWAYGDLFGYLF